MRLEPPPVTTEEAVLRSSLRTFSTDRPRWGWRPAAKMARRAGWQVNDKRIRRLWREEGLRVPQRRRKRRSTGIGVAVGAMSPIRTNVFWAMDFQFDTTADGRTMKMLYVIDEFTREALAIEIDRGIDAEGVVDVLARLVPQHGRRTTSAPTTVPSSWRMRWPIRADSRVLVRFSSIRARRGRTPRSSRSTAGSVMNCSTRGASTRCWKPA